MPIELAHQGATEVLFKIRVPVIWVLFPAEPASEKVAIPSSPEPRTKLFCAVRFIPVLLGSGRLPLFRLIPSAQLSATREFWIVPLAPDRRRVTLSNLIPSAKTGPTGLKVG